MPYFLLVLNHFMRLESSEFILCQINSYTEFSKPPFYQRYCTARQLGEASSQLRMRSAWVHFFIKQPSSATVRLLYNHSLPSLTNVTANCFNLFHQTSLMSFFLFFRPSRAISITFACGPTPSLFLSNVQRWKIVISSLECYLKTVINYWFFCFFFLTSQFLLFSQYYG